MERAREVGERIDNKIKEWEQELKDAKEADAERMAPYQKQIQPESFEEQKKTPITKSVVISEEEPEIFHLEADDRKNPSYRTNFRTALEEAKREPWYKKDTEQMASLRKSIDLPKFNEKEFE